MGLATALPSGAIRSGRRCIDFEQSAHSAQLKFATGETDIADVVIGADGIQSSLQKHVVEPSTPEYSGSRARGLIPTEKVPEWPKEAHQICMGDGKHFMVYPVRSGRLFNVWEPTFSDTWSAKLFMAWQPNGSFRQRGQCLVKVEGQLPVDLNVSCQLSLFFDDSYVSLNFVNGVLER
jgi:2-polyprenyl-6-methoxyphenol hydroxylase-like FAD-dependent oxidoreductase